jgi:hypothetical protein
MASFSLHARAWNRGFLPTPLFPRQILELQDRRERFAGTTLAGRHRLAPKIHISYIMNNME